MRQLVLLAAVAGLAVARPETYREKEDFQFSRSSSDEGSKSGFYGAQRGNMGGNYERAHNMDPLAQNQMSGLVRNVEGELGDRAKQTTGSVYTSANSRGIYGSGNYDLSNLQGRNFQESASHSTQSHTSLLNQHASGYNGQLSTANAGYGNSQTHSSGYQQYHDSNYGGYNTARSSDQALYSSNHHQTSNNLQSASQYEDRTLAQNSGYYSQAAGYQGQVYDQGRSLTHTSDGYGSNINRRLVSGNPVKIVIRPGTKVIIPVAAQTYDTAQSTASVDQNAINSETEVLNTNDQRVKPKAKHYESSYSYRKEWEKHDTIPVYNAVPIATPTVNPYPVNSELYEDAQGLTLQQQRQSASGINLQNHHSSQNGYNAAASSQSSQDAYNSHHHSLGANTGSSAYQSAYNGDSTSTYNNRRISSDSYTGIANGASGLNQVAESSKPKSYQSQYSYHKSWERQGDPYIIKPSTNGLYDGQTSGKLIASSLNQGAYGNSNQYGSHHHSHQGYSSNSNADCDEHGRVARSTHHHQAPTQGDLDQEVFGQQTQQQWDKIEDLGQQTQNFDNVEDLGQQTQNTWDQFGQQTESKWDKLQEGQQTQNQWGVEDLSQQTQSQWDQHDVGQQTQNTWDKLELEPQGQTDLGQDTQDTWTILETKPNGNDASLMEQKPSYPDNTRQHFHGMDMDRQSHENTFEVGQSSNHQMHNTESHTLETGSNKSSHHHVHTIWDEIKKEEIGQETEDTVEDLSQTADLGQQTQVTWDNINHNENNFKSGHQNTDAVPVDLTSMDQSTIFSDKPNPHPWMYNQMHHHQDNRSSSDQYFGHSSSFSSSSGSHSHSWQQEHSTNTDSNSNSNVQINSSSSSVHGSSLMSLWNKLENIEKQTIQGDDKDSQYVRQQSTANIFGTQAQHDVFQMHATDSEPLQPSIASSTTKKPSPEIINNDDAVRPHDTGRGDIGPEELSNEQSKPTNPTKTQEEIETLSLIKEVDGVVQDEADLRVMSLDQQKDSEDKDKQLRSQNGASLIIATQMNNYEHMNHNEEIHHIMDEEIKSHVMKHHFTNQGQQNLDQQTLFGQQFGLQGENMGAEQMEQQFESLNIGQSESFHQEHNKHETEDIGQQNDQFDQVSLSGWKPDENVNEQDSKLVNWGQANENLEQQSQSGWAEHMEDQQVQTAWKPTEDLQQQSQLTDTFKQPKDLNQQVQIVWEPTEDLQQHSQLTDTFEQPIEDLDQQVQTVSKPTEDLQQQSQLTDAFSQQVDKKNNPTNVRQPEAVEEIIIPKKVASVNSPSESESVTEKPGFWNSVGSKFTSAKNTVSSWFSRS